MIYLHMPCVLVYIIFIFNFGQICGLHAEDDPFPPHLDEDFNVEINLLKTLSEEGEDDSENEVALNSEKKDQENVETVCGKTTVKTSRDGHVIGGEDAEQGAWPWAVALTKANRKGVHIPWCTGFLIDRKHILSAANCFDIRQLNLYKARIGHVDHPLGDEYDIVDIAIPDTYVIGNIYDDIAVLTLSKDVDSPNFTPVCLPASSAYRNLTGMSSVVVGWGSTRIGGAMRLHLKQLIDLPIISNPQCEETYRKGIANFAAQFHRGLPASVICTVMAKPKMGPCGGDAGGPLMINEHDRWYAVGIVSFGYLCGSPKFPDGYTRISEYLDWINSIIK